MTRFVTDSNDLGLNDNSQRSNPNSARSQQARAHKSPDHAAKKLRESFPRSPSMRLSRLKLWRFFGEYTGNTT